MQGVLTKVHINAYKYRGERNRVEGNKDLKTRKKEKGQAELDGFLSMGSLDGV